MTEKQKPDEADNEEPAIVGEPIPVPVKVEWIASGVGYAVDDPVD